MGKNFSQSQAADTGKSLRQRAEDSPKISPADVASLSPEEVRALVHELQVHQIELELQNEELRETARAFGEARDRFSDLYEFAPVGYLTFDENGVILEANLRATAMLLVDRQSLIGAKFSQFLHPDAQVLWILHRRAVFDYQSRQVCELAIQPAENPPFWARLESEYCEPTSGRRAELRTALIDITEQKQAEEALRQAHQRLETVVETAPSLIVVTDRQGKIVHFNRTCEEVTGYHREEVLGDTIFERFVPETWRAEVGSRFTNLDPEILRQPHENPWLTKSGEERLIEWRCMTLPAQGGNASWFLIGIGVDVTERKQAEKDLARLGAIIHSSQDAIIGKSLQGTIESWNEAAERIYGYRQEEVVGQSILQLTPPDRQEEVHAFLAKIQHGEPVAHLETVRVRKSGEPIDVSLTVSPIKDRNGQIVGVSAISRDITISKRIERALNENSERMRAILNTASDAIITINRQGMIDAVNPATERMFGYDRKELIGQNVKMLMPSPYCEEHDDYLRRYLESGEAKIIGIGREVEGRRKDGSIFPIDLAVSEVDHLGLFTGIIRDITERKAEQEQLIQSERLALLGEAMAGLTHESRNALARSQSNLRRLARRLKGQDELLEFITGALTANDDVSRQFEEVREYAAPLRLQRTPTSLTEIIHQAWNDLAALREERTAHLTVTTETSDDVCEVDPFPLRNAFRNILENALAACADPVEVTVELLENRWGGEPTLEARFRDSGPGLPPEVRSRAFEAFFTTKTRGTGLGLAIVRRTIEAHGGEVTFGPPSPSGAEIRILLPRSKSS